MSTRSTTHFVGYGGRLEAIIYRHSDGYPEGHGADLPRFFADVEEQTGDTRFGDPSYLAAKLVVWLSREFASSYDAEKGEFVSHANERPLAFLSVGVCQEDPGDIEYRYVVDCEKFDSRGRPTVTCYKREGWGDVDDQASWVAVPVPALLDGPALGLQC